MSIRNTIEFGDCRDIMRHWVGQGVRAQMCVTSPPYFRLRDYGAQGQIGLEPTLEEYIANLIEVGRCVRDVLTDDGTFWLNIGDTYSRAKQLLGVPWRIALALQDDGWVLRQDIVWEKPNAMPESVRDRCTRAHEYLFLLTKSSNYYFDHEALKEPAVGGATGAAASFKRTNSKREQAIPGQGYGTHRPDREDVAYNQMRNKRSVWTVPTRAYKGAHFAVFPPELIEPCVLAGSRPGDIVLDPFMGSGTTAEVAVKHNRHYLGCELNPEYKVLQDKRLRGIGVCQ